MLSLSLASSVSSESGLSELKRSLERSGRSDLDKLNDSALIWSETSNLLHDLTDDGVPTGEEYNQLSGGIAYFGLIIPVGFLTIGVVKNLSILLISIRVALNASVYQISSWSALC